MSSLSFNTSSDNSRVLSNSCGSCGVNKRNPLACLALLSDILYQILFDSVEYFIPNFRKLGKRKKFEILTIGINTQNPEFNYTNSNISIAVQRFPTWIPPKLPSHPFSMCFVFLFMLSFSAFSLCYFFLYCISLY